MRPHKNASANVLYPSVRKGSSIYYVITEEGGGVDPMMTSDDKGGGGVRSLDDVIKQKNISGPIIRNSMVFVKLSSR